MPLEITIPIVVLLFAYVLLKRLFRNSKPRSVHRNVVTYVLTNNPSDEPDDLGDRYDGRYEAFVEELWQSALAVKVDIRLLRIDREGRKIVSTVHSIVPRGGGSCYVNTVEHGKRFTYVGSYHHWFLAGAKVDQSAFAAILAGASLDQAFRTAPYPTSALEAMAPENDHVTTDQHRYVIGYVNLEGRRSYRVVSNIWRGPDRFTAVCHLRWGERRTFLYSGLCEVVDPETGEIIPFKHFVDREFPLKRKRQRKN